MAKPAGSLVPAVRPDLSLSAKEADLSAAALDAFTVALGGRQAVLDALLVASGNPEVDRITTLLIDPSYGGMSLRRLCTLAGLTVADLFVAYRKALLAKAHLQATKVVSDQLVKVVDDVMRRSQPYELTCGACEGLGTITPEPSKKQPNPSPERCRACQGRGKVTMEPDLDRQKVALELGQLLQTRGGITVQQNSLHLPAGGAGGGGAGMLEQLQQAVHEVLYPRPRQSDPEPVVDATAPPLEGEVVVAAEDHA